MYTDFVRVGKHRINLAQVREVLEFSKSDTVRVYWNYTVDGEYRANMLAYDDFKGDEGKLLLAYVDGDEEEIARLDSLLNAPKADWQAPDEPSGTIQTDEEIASADRDEIPW